MKIYNFKGAVGFCIEVNRLRHSFKKIYGRHPDLVIKYQKSVRDMLNDSFPS